MNRMKKEELRKYREAREGLSAEEVAELDRREREEQAFEDEVQLWHGRIFQEEYDFYFDSGVDARDRARGKNPMSGSYIERTNARRRALGFAGYMEEDSALPSHTRGWVAEMLRTGRIAELEAAYERVREEEEAAQQSPTETPEERAKALEECLEGDAYLPLADDWTAAEILAFRIYGFMLFRETDDIDEEVKGFMRPRMPKLHEQELSDALAKAWERWSDIYD